MNGDSTLIDRMIPSWMVTSVRAILAVVATPVGTWMATPTFDDEMRD